MGLTRCYKTEVFFYIYNV